VNKAKFYWLGTMILIGGCASYVTCEDRQTVAGVRTYCVGKVSGDGQEAIFREIYSKDKIEMSHWGSGSSLAGQILGGSGAAAVNGIGLGVPAALGAWQTRVTESTTLENAQDQNQTQEQTSASNSSATSSSKARSQASNKVTNSNHNVNQNDNVNQNKTGVETNVKMKNISGESGGGGVPGCQKAKWGC
jgi:hypothetical protein